MYKHFMKPPKPFHCKNIILIILLTAICIIVFTYLDINWTKKMFKPSWACQFGYDKAHSQT